MRGILPFILFSLFLKEMPYSLASNPDKEVDLEDKVHQLNDEKNTDIEQFLEENREKTEFLLLSQCYDQVQDSTVERLAKYEWPYLQYLELTSNQITGKGVASLIKMAPRLKILELRGNNIKGIPILSFSKGGLWLYLSELRLDDNNLDLSAIENLVKRSWPRLRTLSLARCSLNERKIKVLVAKQFFSFKELKKGLSKFEFVHHVYQEKFAPFNGMYKEMTFPMLEELNLEGNLLKNGGALALTPSIFPKLKWLNLDDTGADDKTTQQVSVLWADLEKFSIERRWSLPG